MKIAYQLEHTPQSRNQAEPAEIWRARHFIHQDSTEAISLTKVAKAVNISANHLSEKFKEVTGVNFVHYVARTRFEKACSLLRDVNLRVSEIAFEVGFQSLSQFNRVFKKLSGRSPTEYRMEYSKAMQKNSKNSENRQNQALNISRKNALSEV